MRTVLGLYNETRDLDMLRNSILLPQSVYIENQRDFFSRIQGAGIYGEIPAGPAGRFTYQLMVGTLNIDEDGGVARQIEDSGMFEIRNFSDGTAYNGSVQWYPPLEGLRFGVTGFKTTDSTSEMSLLVPMGPGVPAGTTFESDLDDLYNIVFSVEYTWENLIVAAEYMDM
ncbi:hypothetical protein DENIS_4148 [Desulfonema ishimotonii]|uniref:TonB-dependent receptor n=1 Tax=Desulfonema ishimotonii TaxID=45657 RepID=A0A401G1S7_9BACT|nr:hypothetical protein [Desulfonema ishimotonii]GBC63155.1 hypothetical protein DENIS_4148 [Desulfonema ishimotonii]